MMTLETTQPSPHPKSRFPTVGLWVCLGMLCLIQPPASAAEPPSATVVALETHLDRLEPWLEARLRNPHKLPIFSSEKKERLLGHLRALEGFAVEDASEGADAAARRVREWLEKLQGDVSKTVPSSDAPKQEEEPSPALPLAVPVKAPSNDAYEDATPISLGTTIANLSGANRDGDSFCDFGFRRDVWFRFVAPTEGNYVLDTSGSDPSSKAVLSTHSGCPGDSTNQLDCSFESVELEEPLLRLELDALEETLIRLGGPSSVEALQLNVRKAGGIEGTVTDAAGEPVQNLLIDVFLGEHHLFATQTDHLGRYHLAGLLPGAYFVRTRSFRFRDQVFDGVLCEPCDIQSGTPIGIAGSEVVDGIDFTLDRLGTIEGTVIESGSGAPVAFAQIEAHGVSSGSYDFATADALGNYSFGGLHDGEYYIYASSEFSTTHLKELYDDVPCWEGCDDALGTPVHTALNAPAAGIDFALHPAGRVRGRVTDRQTGGPLQSVRLTAQREDLSFNSASSNEDGVYSIDGLLPGPYVVTAEDSSDEFLAQIYDDVACPGTSDHVCPLDEGTILEISTATQVNAVDFPLDRAGTISGVVRDAITGEPLIDAFVDVFSIQGQQLRSARTDGNGHYRLNGLTTGSYFVATNLYSGYLNEIHQGIPCPSFPCHVTSGDPVAVGEGTTTSGIDFDLQPLATISGILTETASGVPIDDLRVGLWNALGQFSSGQRPGPLGRYELRDVLPGTYFVTVGGENRYSGEIFDDQPCPGGGGLGCNPGVDGTPIVVSFGDQITDVDFDLSFETGLEGRVTRLETGQPMADVLIDIYSDFGALSFGTRTNANGEYSIGLPPGTYYVGTRNDSGALDELYNGLPCAHQSCEPTDGTPIVLDGTRPVASGIDFALAFTAACDSSSTVACLNGRRFRVEASWRAPDGTTGDAYLSQLSDDSAYAWFFDFANVEMIIKVLDACGLPSNHFWVFAAGLTNLEIELEVTDTETGQTSVYRNPQSTAFQPIQDTGAFATCDAGDPLSKRPHKVPGTSETIDFKGACVPASDTLCLQDGHFAVEALWTTTDGTSGRGQARLLTHDTGTFTFFDPDNIEVVVKLLDVCGAPFDRFWVFAAGLTNIEVTLRVTDTLSGEVREYVNPQGQPFQPIQDTSAFDSCP